MININEHIIKHDESLRTAMEKLNKLSDKLTLFVVNEHNKLIGTLTDGDIRRGLLSNKSIDQKVTDFMYTQFRYIRSNNIDVSLIRSYRQQLIKLLPVLNENNEIVKIIDLSHTTTCLPIDAVIMAGGRGERLRPLTDSIPKPLLPLGNKPIIEHNIDLLIKYGIENIFISVNYLAEKIKNYFGNGFQKGIKLSYVHETKPLGTIGAVGQISNFTNDIVLVMNSDLFTNINLEDMYQTFIDENAQMAIATIPYSIDIPFAVLELSENKIVKSFHEKPTYTFHSNAGIYLFRKEMFKYIPNNEKFDVTELLAILLKKKHNVIKFPIIGYWLDIGRIEDYKKAQEYSKYIN